MLRGLRRLGERSDRGVSFGKRTPVVNLWTTWGGYNTFTACWPRWRGPVPRRLSSLSSTALTTGGQGAAQPAGDGAAAPIPRQGERCRGQGQSLTSTLRWKVALGIELEDRPFARTLPVSCRASPVAARQGVREVFQISIGVHPIAAGPSKRRLVSCGLAHLRTDIMRGINP